MALISIQEATLKFSGPLTFDRLNLQLKPGERANLLSQYYQRDPAEISQTKARSALLSEEMQKAYERWDYLVELEE